MKSFLTKKARPCWLIRLVEVVVVGALLVWIAAGLYVLCGEYVEGLDLADVAAYFILIGIPAAVVGFVLARWMLRSGAKKIDRVLALETADGLSWAQLEEKAGVRDAQALVMRLCDKGYLCCVGPEYDMLTIDHEAASADGVTIRHCPNCGALLEKRTFGDWACRYCGTVAGKK